MLEAELIENRNNSKVEIDLTLTGGHCLLGEMSLLELRERLSLTKEKQKQEEINKRAEIAEIKKQFDLKLQLAQEKVNAHRSLKLKVITTLISIIHYSVFQGAV